MSPVFADLPLARRIDGVEASLSMDIATAVIRKGSVPSAFAQPFGGAGMTVDSWWNTAIHLPPRLL